MSRNAPLEQEADGNPETQTPSTFTNAGTNERRTVVQTGGVLQFELEVYCGVYLSSMLRSQESTVIEMGVILPYKLEEHCSISCIGGNRA